MRGERLRPAAPQAGPVHLALAAVAGIRRDRPSRSSPRRPNPAGTATCRWTRASSTAATTGRWAAGCAIGTSAAGIARDARTRNAGRRRLRRWRRTGRCGPAGSATAPCGLAARRCSATATTPAGRTTAVPVSMSSRPPARTRGPARSTSTCDGCPPGSAWRCSTSFSAAATSGTRNCRPGSSTRSSRSWPARARLPCWNSPKNGGLALHPPRKGRGWRPFILDARRRVEALAFGAGWDTEYPRDIWRLRNLGIDKPEATISFAGIPQAWLRELAKRYARWQLATGLSVARPGPGPGP